MEVRALFIRVAQYLQHRQGLTDGHHNERGFGFAPRHHDQIASAAATSSYAARSSHWGNFRTVGLAHANICMCPIDGYVCRQ